MIKHIRIFMATALPIVVFALMSSAAMAQSYSGNWPLTVTKSHHADGMYCLTLTDNGTMGWPHSGPASVVGQALGNGTLHGTFQLIDRLLMVTIEQPGGSGQDAGLVFIAPASDGDIGEGVYEQVYGGGELDSGVLEFGVKNGC
jgi:hypothetical protein